MPAIFAAFCSLKIILFKNNDLSGKLMKKHICMIAYTNYLTDARVRREAETLAAHPKYKVVFLALKKGDSPRTYQIDGVEVRELNVRKYRGHSNIKYLISYLTFTFLAFAACNNLFLKQQIDFVHVHNMPNFLIFSAIIPRMFGKKIILDIHDTMVETYFVKFRRSSGILPSILRLEESICCFLANSVICVNHLQRAVLIGRGIPSKKLFISLNVPDHRRFSGKNGKRYGKQTPKTFSIVYHGTVAKRLGVDLAIEAISRLTDLIPEVKLYILGNGDHLEEIVQLSKDLNIEKYVIFNKKMVPLETLIELLEQMELGVIPNRKNIATELMLPVKLLEYVSLGIPVVAPKLNAIQYYFSDEMIRYFEPDEVDSLANAILDLYKDGPKRTRQVENALRFFEKYGWEKHKFQLINIYKGLS